MAVQFEYISAVSLIVSSISISLVLVQLSDHIKQRKIDSQIRIDDINREIIAMGFSHPELFKILHGQPADPILERHYLQLWFNQIHLIYNCQERGLFKADRRESFATDIRYFLAQENARKHWRENLQYYPNGFRAFVDALLPPIKTAGSFDDTAA